MSEDEKLIERALRFLSTQIDNSVKVQLVHGAAMQDHGIQRLVRDRDRAIVLAHSMRSGEVKNRTIGSRDE